MKTIIEISKQTDRQKNRDGDRQRQKERESGRETERDSETDRQTENPEMYYRQRLTETQTDRTPKCVTQG